MASGVKLKTWSDDPSDLKAILQETHNQALIQNDFATRHWLKVRDEHLSLRSHLGILPDKLSSEVMVPIGSKALMRGKMVHTNEILVCLGDGWFVKRSAKEAAEICERRIKLCENMLKDLERERDLLTNRKQIPVEQDAFGAEDRNEIFETYDEEKESQWRVIFKKREREYRQKLSELRNKEKTSISNEDSLWKKLDELELQEELEEELDRLHAERVEMGDEGEDTEEETDDSENIEEIEDGPNGVVRRNIPLAESPPNSEQHRRSSRRVSFADERTAPNDSDSDSSTETLRIEFHHTRVKDECKVNKNTDGCCIESPGDIPTYVRDLISKGGPKSILKNKLEVGGTQRMKWLEQPESVAILNDEIEEPPLESPPSSEPPVVFGDVLEHSSAEGHEQSEPRVRISKFKAMRNAAKR
ncbi:hypothetical protein L9F63_012353 [Diploptera punctata]|uniref:Unconventional prefoldin RPB5 interactor n=1 Tax=Diploptera punctata TaxID=6984 RepID=A0AAD8ADL6_DIPPU|nr:hypothetical protein L9F63_012353 [Diploptera punctata]